MPARNPLQSAIESKQHRRRSFGDYRRFVQNHYDGLPGALTAVTGLVTGHEATMYPGPDAVVVTAAEHTAAAQRAAERAGHLKS